MTANTSPDQGQSRSPSEHSEAERAEFEAWARGACNMPDNIPLNWDALWTKAALEGWQAARATPAEAGERTLPSVDTQEFRNALGEWMAMLDYFQSDEHKEVEDVWGAFIAHINAYGQQCARYAVEEYKQAHHTDKGDTQ